jgi:hypothetical protein
MKWSRTIATDLKQARVTAWREQTGSAVGPHVAGAGRRKSVSLPRKETRNPMASFNRVIVLGNVTRDTELRKKDIGGI